MVPVIAHTGGLHDWIWLVIPAVVGLAVLRFAERKARQQAEGEGEEPSDG